MNGRERIAENIEAYCKERGFTFLELLEFRRPELDQLLIDQLNLFSYPVNDRAKGMILQVLIDKNINSPLGL